VVHFFSFIGWLPILFWSANPVLPAARLELRLFLSRDFELALALAKVCATDALHRNKRRVTARAARNAHGQPRTTLKGALNLAQPFFSHVFCVALLCTFVQIN
jgi:hypothetical protein